MKTRLIRIQTWFETLAELLHDDLMRNPQAGSKYDEIYRELSAAIKEAADDRFEEFQIVSMTADRTKNSGSKFWRCFTGEGVGVNVFRNADPLKNSFQHFINAGFEGVMDAMQYGDTINWTVNPITVLCVPEGNFWNVRSVRPRDEEQIPDADEEDDPTLG